MKEDMVSQATQPHGTMAIRTFLLVLGSLCLVLGIVGIVLPVLPTTPFLILAASCYARASRRFYNALLSNRLFGPTIRQWLECRSIPLKTKKLAITLLVVTLGSSIVFFVPHFYLRLALILLGIVLICFILKIPTLPTTVTERM